jgi:hypothetical protein
MKMAYQLLTSTMRILLSADLFFWYADIFFGYPKPLSQLKAADILF